MSVTFGGLATGLDTNALIDGLLAVESIPLQRNQAKQASLGSAKDTLASFLGKVTAVKTSAEALDTDFEFASFAATASDSSIVGTVTGSALAGSYQVRVTDLAQTTRTKSNAFSDSTSALGQSGNLSISVGSGSPTVISVGSGDSLTDIAASINSSDARVDASVIYDGSQHRLIVIGKDTGAANQVTYAESGTVALGLSTSANTYQNAQNATIVLDDQFTISRSTNKFTDVVPGLTITAVKTSTTNSQLSVAPDADAQATKIQSFIDAFNLAISAGHSAAGFGGLQASNKNLSGDSAVRTALDRLGRAVSTPVSGLTGKYNMMAAVGVKLSTQGTLELDKTVLTAALNDDPTAVARVFVGDSALNATGIMKSISETVDALSVNQNSVLELRKGAFESEILRLEEQELSLERRLDDYETRLRRRFTDLEMLVSKIQNQANGLAGFVNFQPMGNSNNNK